LTCTPVDLTVEVGTISTGSTLETALEEPAHLYSLL